MRRLSSATTPIYKWVFPLLWVTIVVLSGSMLWLVPKAGDDPVWLQLLPLLFVLVVGSIIYKLRIADLLDEVWMDGDQLVVKNRGEKARVSLRDVMNVNATTMSNPRRITLMLRSDSRFGRNLYFIPASPTRFLGMFKPDPIATELIGRIDTLRGAPQ
jgi:hypothetical protein